MPDREVEKLAKSLFGVLRDLIQQQWGSVLDKYPELGDWDTLLGADQDNLFGMAEYILANFVPKEEHERAVRELREMISGGRGYTVTPVHDNND